MAFCTQCGNKLEENARFCVQCGAAVKAPAAAPAPAPAPAAPATAPVATAPAPAVAPPVAVVPAAPAPAPAKKGGKGKLWIALAAAATATIVLVVTLLAIFAGGSAANYYYMKNGQLYASGAGMDYPVQLTTGTCQETVGQKMVECAEADLLFYPEYNYDGTFTLCCRTLSDPASVPVEIETGIQNYQVSADGDMILYIKDGTLYQRFATERVKVDDEVVGFITWDGGEKLLYVTEDDTAYYKEGDEPRVKIDGYATGIFGITAQTDTIIYLKDDILYKKPLDGERVKIDNEVHSVIFVEDGKVYYTKKNTNTTALIDYVEDDLAQQDAAITKPVYPTYPDYPNFWEYGSDDEYSAAMEQFNKDLAQYNADRDAYTEQLAAYNQKLARDRLRDTLSKTTYTHTTYTLYYYDGETATMINDTMATDQAVTRCPNGLVYLASETQEQSAVIKLSEIDFANEVQRLVESSMASAKTARLVYNGTDSALDVEYGSYWRFNTDGTALYCIVADATGSETGTFYRLAITNDTASAAQIVDTKVDMSYPTFNDQNEPIYYKNANGSIADLYVNGTLVVEGVYRSLTILDGKLYFFTDWNKDRQEGTLTCFDGEKITALAEDVHAFEVTDEDELLVIADYSTVRESGTLYLLQDGEATYIDDEVSAIVTVYNYLLLTEEEETFSMTTQE